MGLGEIRLGEMGLGEMGLGEMGQNRQAGHAVACKNLRPPLILQCFDAVDRVNIIYCSRIN